MPKTYSLLKVEDGESTYKPQLDNDVDVHKKQVLEKNKGKTDIIYRKKMAQKIFKETSKYDKIISNWFYES